MKYKLSFCKIKQLSENIFETIADVDIVLDKNCADESWAFWNNLRDRPFGLLVNCQNRHSHSFEGSRDIGTHPLQQKTAILLNNPEQEREMKTAMEIKRIVGKEISHQFFSNEAKAIKWLSDV